MISDSACNAVFLSNLLPTYCPEVYNQFVRLFEKWEIKHGLIPMCKDIWVRDFMPLQVKEDYFIYSKLDRKDPQTEVGAETISDTQEICQAMQLRAIPRNIKLQGSNVVTCGKKAIVTTKVFKENNWPSENALISEIRSLLNVEQLIVIPQEPNHPVGHADSMVRFLDESTVLINQYPDNSDYGDFGLSLRWNLRNAGLHYVELPYTAWSNENANDATGCYMNYLEIGEHIFMPLFGTREDMAADIQFQYAFEGRSLHGIVCPELAKSGGVLNRATWCVQLSAENTEWDAASILAR